MRILYLTQSFPPEPGATVRPLKQAASLKRLGHDVTVITSMPFYPYGRVYPGYRWRLVRRETREGVRVLRLWSVPSPNHGVARRLLSYGSFAALSALAGLLQPRPDLVLASVPSPGTELAGLLIARLRSSRCVVEACDLVTESLTSIGHSPRGVLARMAAAYMRIVYRLADAIAVPCPSMVNLLRRQGVPRGRVLLLPHAADPMQAPDSQAVAAIRKAHRLDGRFVALFAGNLAPYYGLDTLIEAARLLQRMEAPIKLVLLGTGTERGRLERIIRDEDLHTLALAGPVPPDEVAPYLHAADLLITSIGMTCYEPGSGFLYTKECQYLMAGKPIVAVEERPRMKLILDSVDAGVGVAQGDSQGLVEALQWHAGHLEDAARRGRNARQYAQRHLLRDDLVRAFEQGLRGQLRFQCRG